MNVTILQILVHHGAVPRLEDSWTLKCTVHYNLGIQNSRNSFGKLSVHVVNFENIELRYCATTNPLSILNGQAGADVLCCKGDNVMRCLHMCDFDVCCHVAHCSSRLQYLLTHLLLLYYSLASGMAAPAQICVICASSVRGSATPPACNIDLRGLRINISCNCCLS